MSIAVNPDEPFHVVHQGNVIAVSLEQLDTAYQADQVADDTLIWQEGFAEWMRLDMLLHTLAEQEGPVAPMPEVADDIYYVLVAPEEVKQMSLDLLADAYRLEVIDDSTLVWQPGFTEWLPLSALLGAEDEHVSIAPSMPPAYNGGYAPAAPVYREAPAPVLNFGSMKPLDDSLAPAADWSILPQQPKTSPWYGRTLIGLGAMGAVFALYRSGALESGAEGPEAGSLMASVESKVGAPGVDTTQGLDRWLAKLEDTHGLKNLSETTPVPGAKDVALPAEAAPAAAADPSSPEPIAAGKASAEPAPAAQAPEKPVAGAAAAFSSSLSGAPKKTVAQAPARKQVRAKSSSSGGKAKGGANHAYDPMNGAL